MNDYYLTVITEKKILCVHYITTDVIELQFGWYRYLIIKEIANGQISRGFFLIGNIEKPFV